MQKHRIWAGIRPKNWSYDRSATHYLKFCTPRAIFLNIAVIWLQPFGITHMLSRNQLARQLIPVSPAANRAAGPAGPPGRRSRW